MRGAARDSRRAGQVTWPGQTEEAIRCGGELAASGEAGAVLSMSQPGPYPTEDEWLVVIGADGTAYRQLRSRCSVEGACEDQNTTAWRRSALERCAIDVDPEQIAGCGTTDGTCAWYGQAKDCAPVADAGLPPPGDVFVPQRAIALSLDYHPGRG